MVWGGERGLDWGTRLNLIRSRCTRTRAGSTLAGSTLTGGQGPCGSPPPLHGLGPRVHKNLCKPGEDEEELHGITRLRARGGPSDRGPLVRLSSSVIFHLSPLARTAHNNTSIQPRASCKQVRRQASKRLAPFLSLQRSIEQTCGSPSHIPSLNSLPPEEVRLKAVADAAARVGAGAILLCTDRPQLAVPFREKLLESGILPKGTVVHLASDLQQRLGKGEFGLQDHHREIAVLAMADAFLGVCWSSFSAFAARARLLGGADGVVRGFNTTFFFGVDMSSGEPPYWWDSGAK